MAEPAIKLTFHGGDADNNSIDMRLLGQSLQGADKIISDGLIVLIHNRPPKRGERAPVLAKVREPIQGSYEFWSFFEAAAGLLPLAAPVAEVILSNYIEQWWLAVKARFMGNPDAVAAAMQSMEQVNRDHLAARNVSEERTHEFLMAQNTALLETIAMQQRALEKFVSPIGPSVDSAEVVPAKAAPVLVSNDDADEIRERAKIDWRELRELRLRTDGFRFHTNGLSIENPETDGFLMAKVSDPAFKEPENAYTEAAQRRSEIVVLARRGYQDGKLVKIDIVDFKNEIAP